MLGKVRGSETLAVTAGDPVYPPPCPPPSPANNQSCCWDAGASNTRLILPDAGAILVWHAVFSSLRNTSKAPQRCASSATTAAPFHRCGGGAAASAQRFRPPTRLVCLFGKQAAPVAGTPVANGAKSGCVYVPHVFPPACFFPSVALTSVNAGSVKQ